MTWRDKVVLVTGGSAGLGKEIAKAFAALGAKIVIAARDADKLESAAGEIGRACRQEPAGGPAPSGNVLAVPTDITVDDAVEALFAGAIDRFGRLDVLVNCAGRSSRRAIRDVTAEESRVFLELNYLAAVRCTRAALAALLESGGHVVNIASLAAKVAPRYMGAYPPSKFALAAYSQQLRLELGPQGLHVLLVCPGPIAREEPRDYGAAEDANLPEAAGKPGGGAKTRLIDPADLATRIVRACERRRAELIVPGKARLLFAISQLCPRWGDWLLGKMT